MNDIIMEVSRECVEFAQNIGSSYKGKRWASKVGEKIYISLFYNYFKRPYLTIFVLKKNKL